MTTTTTDRTLFPTAAELGAPPPKREDDLGRIRVVDRDSAEGQAILAERAARQARRDLIEGLGDRDVVRAGKLAGVK